MSVIGPSQIYIRGGFAVPEWPSPPSAFVYNGTRFYFSMQVTAFPAARIRVWSSPDGTANSWSEVGVGGGPIIRFSTAPTFIQHPTDPTKVIIAYCDGSANNGFIAYTTFDMNALAWGVPNVSTVNGEFDWTDDDKGITVCVDYRPSDGQLIFEYSGPSNIVGGPHYPRVWTVQANLISGVWSAATALLSGVAQTLNAAGIVVDPATSITYFILNQIDPTGGPTLINSLFLIQMTSANVIGAPSTIATDLQLTHEPVYGYVKLRSLQAGGKELMIPYLAQGTLNIICARAPLSSLIWTEEIVGAPIGGDTFGFPSVAVDPVTGKPSVIFDDGDPNTPSAYISAGDEPGIAWVQSTLWTGDVPSGDFFENPTAASLPGIGIAAVFARSQVSNSSQVTANPFGPWYFEVRASTPPPAPVPFISLKYVPAPGRPGTGIQKFKKR